MKTLLLLRHAKSSWKKPLPDHERPLNRRGKRQVPQVARWLREESLVPDVVLCSTARRARRTAELLLRHGACAGEIRLTPDLYDVDAEEHLEVLSRLESGYNRVMLIGHNPGLLELLRQFAPQVEALSTAAVALLQFDIDGWSQLHTGVPARLDRLWRPDEP